MKPESRFLENIELRSAEDGKTTVSGYAVLWNSTYTVGGAFTEEVKREAFVDLEKQDIRALYDHDKSKVLARFKQGTGTLRLRTDDRGLYYEFEAPNTTDGRNLVEQLKRGDISGSSWSWDINGTKDKWTFRNDMPHRVIEYVSTIYDVSPTAFPVNVDTTAALRSLEAAQKEAEQLKNDIPMKEETTNQAPAQPVEEVRAEKFVDSSAIQRGFGEKTVKELRKFNPMKVVRELAALGKVTGLEAELHQEGVNFAKRHGYNVKDGLAFHMPIHLQAEARANVVGTDASGGYLVDNDFKRFIEFLWPNSPVTSLCDVNDNLEGDVIFPTEATVPSLNWGTETGASVAQTPTFGQVTSSPTRAHITIEMSRRLLIQEHSQGIQNRLTRQMNRAFNTGVETALLVGSGASNQPTGIMTALNGSLQVVGVPTHKKMIDNFELVLANADALQGRLAYVTDPATLAFLKATVLDAGSGKFLAEGKLNEVLSSNGYPVYTTTVMPLFTAKHGMVFGNFEDVTLNFWGGPVLIVNPYTKMKESLVEVYMERQMDVKVVRNASFAVSKDIVYA